MSLKFMLVHEIQHLAAASWVALDAASFLALISGTNWTRAPSLWETYFTSKNICLQ